MAGLTVFTKTPFITPNNDEVKAANTPKPAPNQYLPSTEKIKSIAIIIIKPITISYSLILRLKNIGSIIALNKVPVLNAAIVTLTFDALIAP